MNADTQIRPIKKDGDAELLERATSDARISWGAIGVLVHLVTLEIPKCTLGALTSEIDNLTKVRRYVKELVDNGYVEVVE